MAQKGLWNIAIKRMLEDRGSLPKEEGDLIREDKAMHEGKLHQQLVKEGCGR